MSILMKNIQNLSKQAIQILKLCPVQNQKRHVYDISVFGVKEFKNMRINAAKKSNPGFLESIKKRLENSISDESINSIEIQDLNQLILLSQNDQDIDLLMRSFKKYKNLLLIDKDEKFGEQFTKLCLDLNKIDFLIKALDDEDIQPSLMDQLTSFLIMNKMIIEKKYDLAVDVFENYLKSITNKVKNNERPNSKTKLKKQFQLIPFGHLRLVFEALLLKNSKESFLKMKDLMVQTESFNSKLNNTAKACCFLLSINQNEPNFAYQIALSFDKFNITLQNNLKSIALSKLDRIDESSYFIDSIIKMKIFDDKNDFEGKIFPNTLQSFKALVEKIDQADLKKKQFYELMIKEVEKRLFKYDLFGYCTNINYIDKSKKINKI